MYSLRTDNHWQVNDGSDNNFTVQSEKHYL